MNKTEAAIQYLIYRHHNFKRVLTNVHTERWNGSEVDAFYWTDTDKAFFYEIKISKADFKNDMKKKRHQLLLDRNDTLFIKPKYFIYVCYGFEVWPSEIPEYAGLIYVRQQGLKVYEGNSLYLKEIKKPPILWKESMTKENIVFLQTKIMHRYLKQRHELGRAELERL